MWIKKGIKPSTEQIYKVYETIVQRWLLNDKLFYMRLMIDMGEFTSD